MARPHELTPPEKQRARNLVESLQARGWGRRKIAKALGFGSPTSIHRILHNEGTSREKYDALEALACKVAESGEAPPQPTPTTKMSSTPSSNMGILGHLEAARSDITSALDKLKRAEENAMPLLRPGITQMISRLVDTRNNLEIK